MSGEIAKPQNFEERMKDRIRESIGDLITDEDLSKLVHRALDEAFFGERTEGDTYNKRVVKPLMHEIVADILAVEVRAEVQKWLVENEGEVMAVVEEIVQDGAGNAVIHAVNAVFSGALSSMQMNMVNAIDNLRNGSSQY